MGNAPKITKITLDRVQYDIDLPSDASPVIDSLKVTNQLIVPEINDSKADNEAANKGYVDAKDAYLQEQINTIEARSDVVDVVGTKAELLAYDTSNISEDDVIKVLADESLNNAITYYRWSANEWSLIGQIGPYVLIKTNAGNKVYVHNDATQADLTYTKDAAVNTIVERTTNGNINLPDASKINANSYATSKLYVDNAITTVNNTLTNHTNNKNNPHAVNQSQVGLGNVVNTGDSNEPVSGGTKKFTTGGAFTLKTTLESEINNLGSKINNLDLATVGSNGGYIKTIEQSDGHVSATRQPFDTSVGSNSTDDNAPTSRAVNTAITSAANQALTEAKEYTDTNSVNEEGVLNIIQNNSEQVDSIDLEEVSELSIGTSTNFNGEDDGQIPTSKAVRQEINNKASDYYNKVEIDNKASNYYNKVEIDNKFSNYYNKVEIDNKFSNYYNKAEAETIIDEKINVAINDILSEEY